MEGYTKLTKYNSRKKETAKFWATVGWAEQETTPHGIKLEFSTEIDGSIKRLEFRMNVREALYLAEEFIRQVNHNIKT